MPLSARRRHNSGARDRGRRYRSLDIESLEARLALAVIPILDGRTLKIGLTGAGDSAVVSQEGRQFVVRGQAEIGSFAVTQVASIVVTGSPAPAQAFTLSSGGPQPIIASLSVDANVESTTLRGQIATLGDVIVKSPAIELAADIRTRGEQRFLGAVTVHSPVGGTIPLPVDGQDWSMGEDAMVMSRAGNVLLAVSSASQSVAIIDPRVTALRSMVGMPLLPKGVAVTADGARAFVGHDLVQQVGGIWKSQLAISAIDVNGRRVSETRGLGEAGFAKGMAVSPDGTRVYVVQSPLDGSAPKLVVVDAATLTVQTTIALPLSPRRVQSILVSDDGKRVYVVDAGVNSGGIAQTFINPSITVVDATTNAVTGTIDLGVFGSGALADCRLGNDGKTAFAISVYGMVGVIDLARMTVTKTFWPVGQGQHVRLAPSSDGRWLRILYPTGQASRVVDVRIADGVVGKSRSVPAAGRIIEAPGGGRMFLRIDSGIAVINASDPATGVLTLQGSNVAFNSTVDGPAGLSVLSPGKTLFAGVVGATRPLASLATDSGGSVSLHSVFTTGMQRYADRTVELGGQFTVTRGVTGEAFAVLGKATLAADTWVAAAGGRITFHGAIDGHQSLTVTGGWTGLTDVVFQGALGAKTPLQSLRFGGLAGVSADKAIIIDGLLESPWGSSWGPYGISIDGGARNVRLVGVGSSIRHSNTAIQFVGSAVNSLISGFTFQDNVTGVILIAGDYSGTRISGNTFINNVTGIWVGGYWYSYPPPSGATIRGNVIRSNSAAGIRLSGSVAILSNSIVGNGGQGILDVRQDAWIYTPQVQSIERARGMIRLTVLVPLGGPTSRFQIFATPSSRANTGVGGDVLRQGDRVIADVVGATLRDPATALMKTTVLIPANRVAKGEWITVTMTDTISGQLMTGAFSAAVRCP